MTHSWIYALYHTDSNKKHFPLIIIQSLHIFSFLHLLSRNTWEPVSQNSPFSLICPHSSLYREAILWHIEFHQSKPEANISVKTVQDRLCQIPCIGSSRVTYFLFPKNCSPLRQAFAAMWFSLPAADQSEGVPGTFRYPCNCLFCSPFYI